MSCQNECIEPYTWDYENDGIWQCDCPRTTSDEDHRTIEEVLKDMGEL